MGNIEVSATNAGHMADMVHVSERLEAPDFGDEGIRQELGGQESGVGPLFESTPLPEIPPRLPRGASAAALLKENQELRALLDNAYARVGNLEHTLHTVHRAVDASMTARVKRLAAQKARLQREIEQTAASEAGDRHRLETEVARLEEDRNALSSKITEIETRRRQSVAFGSKRSNVLKEFFFTERTYVQGLKTLRTEYVLPIEQRRLLPEEDFRVVFGAVQTILQTNSSFLAELEKTLFSHTADEALVELVLQFSSHFKSYSDYISSYAKAHQVLTDAVERRRKLERFLNETSTRLRDEESESGVSGRECTASGLMITPIQRLPRYLLLLKDLLKYTQEAKPQYSRLVEAISSIRAILEYCDEQSRLFQDRLRMIELSKRLNLTLIQKSLVFENARVMRINAKGHRRPATLYLLSDLLVVQDSKKSKLRGKAKQSCIPIWTSSADDESGAVASSTQRTAPRLSVQDVDDSDFVVTLVESDAPASHPEGGKTCVKFAALGEMRTFLSKFDSVVGGA